MKNMLSKSLGKTFNTVCMVFTGSVVENDQCKGAGNYTVLTGSAILKKQANTQCVNCSQT